MLNITKHDVNTLYEIKGDFGNMVMRYSELWDIYKFIEKSYTEEDFETALNCMVNSSDDENVEAANRFDKLTTNNPELRKNLVDRIIENYKDNLCDRTSEIWCEVMEDTIIETMNECYHDFNEEE